jgi:N-acetyl sugar amidotransferase
MTIDNYKQCTKTIMDNIADPQIIFDDKGVCNYVREYERLVRMRIPPSSKLEENLRLIIDKIKRAGKGKEYDCIIGLSGGIDSSYVAYLVVQYGLRPLAIHLDNGWDSELAVSNIEKLIKKLNIDLFTEVLDWNEFKDIQLSYLKASVPDGEIPTDHAIYATLYKYASKFKIKYILSGTNIKTEGILPRSWARGHLDFKYISGIVKKFGKVKIRQFPHLTLFRLLLYNLFGNLKLISLLDYVDYNKSDATKILEDNLGWIRYGSKHYESVYTRFYQGFILPRKFNIDKRKAHLSTLICSGQIDRESALNEIKLPPYLDSDLLRQDLEFVRKKLNLTSSEFDKIMDAPPKSIGDYPNNFLLIEKFRSIYNFLKKRNII